MNYYQPRQRKSDSRWDFTRMNDNVVWPVGYCRSWEDWSEEDKARFHISEGDYQEMARFKDKHHEDGHATPEEASECYKQYLLDQRLNLDGETEEYHQCGRSTAIRTQRAVALEFCDQLTNRYAQVDNTPVAWLCDTHRTRETVELLYRAPSSIISSY